MADEPPPKGRFLGRFIRETLSKWYTLSLIIVENKQHRRQAPCKCAARRSPADMGAAKLP